MVDSYALGLDSKKLATHTYKIGFWKKWGIKKNEPLFSDWFENQKRVVQLKVTRNEKVSLIGWEGAGVYPEMEKIIKII